MNADTEMLDFAKKTARSAGAVLMRYFGNKISYEFKHEKTIVTEADYESENLIIDAIRTQYPSHSILAEERGRSQSDDKTDMWIIDPLDGTTNFAAGIPLFGVSIAFQINQITEIGVIYDPVRDEMFSAKRGQGAYLNGTPIHTRPIVQMEEAIAGFDIVLFEGKREQIIRCMEVFGSRVRSTKILGAAVLSFAYLASGRYDVYFANVLRPWDLAAGLLLVEEAGGEISSFNGEPVDIMSFENVFASTDSLHLPGLDLLRNQVMLPLSTKS
jgi:myo-inositol-1(or 4)-monophosphatase